MVKLAIFYVWTFLAMTFVTTSHASYTIDVYKSASCGCCAKWLTHLQAHGFATTYFNEQDLSAIKDELNVPETHRSCHTGVVVHAEGRYVFEGHIPAETIQRFLSNPPEAALGLTVPGMPIGSPGMEMGERKDYYEVYLMLENGDIELYEKVNERSS